MISLLSMLVILSLLIRWITKMSRTSTRRATQWARTVAVEAPAPCHRTVMRHHHLDKIGVLATALRIWSGQLQRWDTVTNGVRVEIVMD